MNRSPLAASLQALLLTAVLGCASGPPIGVYEVDAREAHKTLTANALSREEPSAFSMAVLQRTGLTGLWMENREAALAELHASARSSQYNEGLFALAELSFLTAEKTEDKRWLAACVVYAYAYLFPDDGLAPDSFDPRLRIAADLYNRALTQMLTKPHSLDVDMRGGQVELPFGTLVIRFDDEELIWAGRQFREVSSVANYEIYGIEPRYREPGIGAPLSAGFGETAPTEGGAQRVGPRARVPASAFLRISDPIASILSGEVVGDLELFTIDEDRAVEIGGRRVPIEYESTASLAFMLGRSRVWEFAMSGFLSGDFRLFDDQPDDGLMLLYPYKRGRIPIVLVHGTLSSPATWSAMLNELSHDPTIVSRYQFWFFFYNTANPILHSGERLRRGLRNAVTELDPDGTDPALQQMVVIGHSQGGLVSRLAVSESGNHFWSRVSDVPFDEVEIDVETREFLGDRLFFEPVSSIDSMVFIATPQRGSYVAGWGLARWGGRLTSFPRDLTRGVGDLILSNPDAFRLRDVENMSTAVDNMSPGDPFLQALAEAPIPPDVGIYSIVAVQGDGPVESGADGVVKYESAHIDWAESELVVRSGHSTLATPATINEVRRILYERAGIESGTNAASAPESSPDAEPR